MLLTAVLLQAAQPLPPPPPGYELDRILVPACQNRQPDCEPWERDWSVARPRETDYFLIGRSTRGDTWFVQNLSLVRARGMSFPELWVRVDFVPSRTDRSRRSVALVRVNCAERQIAYLSDTRYTAAGAVLHHEELPSFAAPQYEHAVPGSMNSSIIRSACDQARDAEGK